MVGEAGVLVVVGTALVAIQLGGFLGKVLQGDLRPRIVIAEFRTGRREVWDRDENDEQ
jgi:hypothetical protein